MTVLCQLIELMVSIDHFELFPVQRQALTEPAFGSDASSLNTTATKVM